MKLIDILNLNRESAFPNSERVLRKVLNRSKKVAAVWILGAFLVVAVGASVLAARFLLPQEPQKEVVVNGAMNIIESIESKKGSMMNLSVDSTLQIKTTEDVSAKELKARIKLEPQADYSVRKAGECRYTLSFEGLSENTLYNVAAVYNGAVVYRWAFQTHTPFGVEAVSPTGNGKASVDTPIEVTFSHGDVSGFEEAFSIFPKVEGTFEHYGRTWSFIPSAPLQESTLYTVTLASSIKGPDDASFDKEYSFTFKTEDGSSYAYLLYRDTDLSDTFLVNERPVAAVAYENIKVSSAKVRVYTLKDSDSYVNAYKKYVLSGTISDKIMELADHKQMEFESTPVTVADYNDLSHAAFINYPDALPQGYYFAEIELGGKTLYQLLQSTNLSVYTLVANGDYVVWVNDGQSGAPLSGVELNLEGFSKTKTASTGVAILKNASDTLSGRFLAVDNGAYPYVAVVNGDQVDQKIEQCNLYYSYLTTDSSLYRRGETIGIFGAILPRVHGAKAADNITLEADFLDEPIPLKPDKNGAFSAKITLPAVAFDYGEIKLMMGSIHIDSAYFSIDQGAPAYKLSLSTDRKAYKAGDSIHFSALLTHSDGTPAAGVALSNSDGIEGLTDENGNFKGTLIAESEENAGNYSVKRFFLQVGETGIFADIAYLVFSSDYIIEAEYKNGQLSVATFEVDFMAAEMLSEDALFREVFDASQIKGDPISAEVTAEIHELSYLREANGGTYDEVNKKADTVYRYVEQDNILRTIDLNCSSGIASIDLKEEANIKKNYYVNLRMKGDAHVFNQIYLRQPQYFDGFNESTYDISMEEYGHSEGENITLRVRDNRDHEIVNSGSVVYAAVSGGVLDVYQSNSPIISFPFKKDYAPQVAIFGAYFDGKHVYSLGRESLYYNHEDSALTIEIESEQDQYKAGEKAVLNFKVLDREGNPVESTLNVSLMDRALYLTNHNATNPIYDFYSSSEYYDLAYTFESHRDFRQNKKEHYNEGWDGFSMLACDYEPSSYFETLTTNSRGEASITIELPDSLTHWKVVARAVTSKAQGGISFYDLITSQGFYVNAVVPDDLKNSEDCVVALRAEGAYLAEDAICSFKVGFTDRDGAEIKTLEATAQKGAYAYLNFGKLSTGFYTAYIQSSSGNFTHSVIKSFEVGGSVEAKRIQGNYTADGADLAIFPLRGKAALTIVDEGFAFRQQALERLIAVDGDRVDQVLASALIEQMLESGSWEERDGTDLSAISAYMDMGSVKLRKDAEHGDLWLSATIAAVASEFCDREALANYLEQYLNNRYASPADRLIAYFGLVSLGKPMMADLQAIYKSGSDFSAEEWVYMALGFAYGGDYTTAEYIADHHIKAYLAGDDEKKYIVVDGEVQDELTGAFAILCSRLNLENSESLLRFIMDGEGEKALLNLGLIAYLNDYFPNRLGENKITISTADGKVLTHSYRKHQPLLLQIERDAAENIRITNVEGTSLVHYVFYGEADS